MNKRVGISIGVFISLIVSIGSWASLGVITNKVNIAKLQTEKVHLFRELKEIKQELRDIKELLMEKVK